MTFDDENKPKSQDIPNTQVPQASGDEVEPQSGAVGANAGGLEEMDAKEAAVQLGHNARQADSEATQMFNPNDYAVEFVSGLYAADAECRTVAGASD